MSANWGDVELLVKHKKVGLSKTGSALNDWPSYQLQPHHFESAQLEIRDFSSPNIFARAHHEAKHGESVQAYAACGLRGTRRACLAFYYMCAKMLNPGACLLIYTSCNPVFIINRF